MSTDPFDNIQLNQEIGQPTFVELIAASPEMGIATGTICHEIKTDPAEDDPLQEPECSQNTNVVFNGDFSNGLDGWQATDDISGGSVYWTGVEKQSVILTKQPGLTNTSIEQSIVVIPGQKMKLLFNINQIENQDKDHKLTIQIKIGNAIIRSQSFTTSNGFGELTVFDIIPSGPFITVKMINESDVSSSQDPILIEITEVVLCYTTIDTSTSVRQSNGVIKLCDQGLPPRVRLRDLAFGKKPRQDRISTTAIESNIPIIASVARNITSQKISQEPTGRILKSQKDFNDLLSSSPEIVRAFAGPNGGDDNTQSQCVSAGFLVINGFFINDLSGWVALDAIWDRGFAAIAQDGYIQQSIAVSVGSTMQLDFTVNGALGAPSWELTIEIFDGPDLLYESTVNKGDGDGDYNIYDIPSSNTGEILLKFTNTSSIDANVNVDDVALCLRGPSCPQGFNLVDITDFTSTRNNWESNSAIHDETFEITANREKGIDFTSDYGFFFADDESGDIGVAMAVTSSSGDQYAKKQQYQYNVNGDVVAIFGDDLNAKVYIASQNGADFEITSFNYDGTNPQIIVSRTAIIQSFAVDPSSSYIFWSEPGNIYRCENDGSLITNIYTSVDKPTGAILGITVDKTAKTLYFPISDSAIDLVITVDYDGGSATTIDNQVFDPFSSFNITSIAIDAHNELLIMGAVMDNGRVVIFQMQTDGSVLTELLEVQNSGHVSSVDLHPSGKIYYSTGLTVWRSNPNGTNAEKIFKSSFTTNADIKGSLSIISRKGVSFKWVRGVTGTVRFFASSPDTIDASSSLCVTIGLSRPEDFNNEEAKFNGTKSVTVLSPVGFTGVISAIISVEATPTSIETIEFDQAIICAMPGNVDRPQCSPAAPTELYFNDFTTSGFGGGWDFENKNMGLGGNFQQFQTLTINDPIVEAGDFITFTLDITHIESDSIDIYAIPLAGFNPPPFASFEGITQTGRYTFSGITPSPAFGMQIQYFTDNDAYASFDNLLICINKVINCKISTTRINLEWDGSPTQPINIFEGFVRYKLRDNVDPTKVGYVDQPITEFSQFALTNPCDTWDQNGQSSNPLELTVDSLSVSGNEQTPPNTNNWIWSNPKQSGTGNNIGEAVVVDSEIDNPLRKVSGDAICTASINDPNYNPNCIIESVEIFLHINIIDLEVANVEDYCSTGFLSISLAFIDGEGRSRKFTKEINPKLFINNVSALSEWDGETGIPGDVARWESFEFVLDNTIGTGLNQCTDVDIPTFTGSGCFDIKPLTFTGVGFYTDGCTPSVEVLTDREGSITNEIQSIVLPNPSGGNYDITLSNAGVTGTVTVPFNADAEQLRVRLGQLTPVAGTRNIETTGSGTEEDPFLVTFVDQLAARDMNLMKGSALNLTGTGEVAVRTIRSGSFNEQQTVINSSNSQEPFRLTFNGETTVEMAFNISLNGMQTILSGLTTIGAGNISVSGSTSDRESEYEGPWVIEFVGTLAAQNLAEMLIQSDSGGYQVITDWNGGVGINEIQEIAIKAQSGVYTIIFTHPDTGFSESTGDISYNSPAEDIKNVVIGSISFLNNINLSVRDMGVTDGYNVFHLIFRDNLYGIDLNQVSISTSNLNGGSLIITEVEKGGGINEKQRIQFLNVNGGTWRIRMNVPSAGPQTTGSIPWDAEPEEIEEALVSLPNVDFGDISVGGAFPLYFVVFKKSLGNVSDLEIDRSNLECTGFSVIPIDPGPYEYDIDPTIIPNGDGADPEEELLRRLPDELNRYYRTRLEKYLFDPNSKNIMTVRDLALMKGFNIEEYNPYKRISGVLIPVDYSQVVATKDSYMIINANLDSVAERQRILKHLRDRGNILPARFVWESINVV